MSHRLCVAVTQVPTKIFKLYKCENIENNVCSEYAICLNTFAGYNCKCKSGFLPIMNEAGIPGSSLDFRRSRFCSRIPEIRIMKGCFNVKILTNAI